METLQSNGRRAIAVKREKLAQDRDREVQQIEQRLERELREVQMGYKLKALLLPPILPLLLAFFVYFHRRHQEREGVAKTRLR